MKYADICRYVDDCVALFGKEVGKVSGEKSTKIRTGCSAVGSRKRHRVCSLDQ